MTTHFPYVGLWLFLIFVNYLHIAIVSMRCLFADDLQLICSFYTIDALVEDLRKLWNMCWNVNKCLHLHLELKASQLDNAGQWYNLISSAPRLKLNFDSGVSIDSTFKSSAHVAKHPKARCMLIMSNKTFTRSGVFSICPFKYWVLCSSMVTIPSWWCQETRRTTMSSY